MRSAYGAVVLGLVLFTGAVLGQGRGSGQGGTSKGTPNGGGKVGGLKEFPAKDSNEEKHGGKTLKEWIAEMKGRDISKRSLAILWVMEFTNSFEAVDALIERLEDGDVSPRAKALLALRSVGVRGGGPKDLPRPDGAKVSQIEKVVKAVAKRLRPWPGDVRINLQYTEPQAIIRYEAAVTLQRFIYDLGPVLGDLRTGMHDPDSWEIRFLCTSLLWRYWGTTKGQDGKPETADEATVKALLGRAMQPKETYQVRLEALQGLAMVGCPKTYMKMVLDSMAAFSRATTAPPVGLVVWARTVEVVYSSSERDAKKALDSIAKFLQHKSPEARGQAAAALGTLGPLAEERVDSLLKLLKDEHPEIVQGACIALARIGKKDDKVIDALLDVLQHEDYHRSMSAIRAFVTLKAKDKKVIDALEKLQGKKGINGWLLNSVRDGLERLKKANP